MYLLLDHYILWYKGDNMVKLYFRDNKISLNCIYMRCVLPPHTVIHSSILKTNTTHYLFALVILLIRI